MATQVKEMLETVGTARVFTYRAQADLCRRLASAGHLSETRQNLEDIAASYDQLADDMDLVASSDLWRSSHAASDVQRAQRHRSRLRRNALIATAKAS
jgi:hypothetical protein